MSHAICIVFGTDDIDSAMAPYEDRGSFVDGEWVDNPDGHWNWFEIGGRWDAELILKDGTTSNQAQARDIDWAAMDRREMARWAQTEVPRRWLPFACVVGGVWRHQSQLVFFGEDLGDCDPDVFAEGIWDFIDEIASSATLVTVVDYHN